MCFNNRFRENLQLTTINIILINDLQACQMAMVKRLCTIATVLHPQQSHIMLCEARKLMRASPRIVQVRCCFYMFSEKLCFTFSYLFLLRKAIISC